MTALQMNGSVKKDPNECDVVGNTAITEPEDYLPSIEYIHTSFHDGIFPPSFPIMYNLNLSALIASTSQSLAARSSLFHWNTKMLAITAKQ